MATSINKFNCSNIISLYINIYIYAYNADNGCLLFVNSFFWPHERKENCRFFENVCWPTFKTKLRLSNCPIIALTFFGIGHGAVRCCVRLFDKIRWTECCSKCKESFLFCFVFGLSLLFCLIRVDFRLSIAISMLFFCCCNNCCAFRGQVKIAHLMLSITHFSRKSFQKFVGAQFNKW